METIALPPSLLEAGVPGALFGLMAWAAYRIVAALWQTLQEREADLRALIRDTLEQRAAVHDSLAAAQRQIGDEAARLRDQLFLLLRELDTLNTHLRTDPANNDTLASDPASPNDESPDP